MKTVELFSGTASFSKVMKAHGHDTWWKPRPICHNRRKDCPDYCCCHDHEAASRGSRTGTQGLKGATERGKIPPQLFEEILNQMPE